MNDGENVRYDVEAWLTWAKNWSGISSFPTLTEAWADYDEIVAARPDMRYRVVRRTEEVLLPRPETNNIDG